MDSWYASILLNIEKKETLKLNYLGLHPRYWTGLLWFKCPLLLLPSESDPTMVKGRMANIFV
jgi:hypothetical protein